MLYCIPYTEVHLIYNHFTRYLMSPMCQRVRFLSLCRSRGPLRHFIEIKVQPRHLLVELLAVQ